MWHGVTSPRSVGLLNEPWVMWHDLIGRCLVFLRHRWCVTTLGGPGSSIRKGSPRTLEGLLSSLSLPSEFVLLASAVFCFWKLAGKLEFLLLFLASIVSLFRVFLGGFLLLCPFRCRLLFVVSAVGGMSSEDESHSLGNISGALSSGGSSLEQAESFEGSAFRGQEWLHLPKMASLRLESMSALLDLRQGRRTRHPP